ncbi:MAG: virB8 family protein [Rickettsiaceae bacterium]
MIKLSSFLSKFFNKPDAKSNSGEYTKHWYDEKYETMLVQRNLLVIVFFISLFLSFILIASVVYIVNTRTFDPFVIQIDDTTGEAIIVKPVMQESLSDNQSLARYFIKKYVVARETYNPVDFDSYARRVVYLCSTDKVFEQFLGYFNSKGINPEVKYGDHNTTFLLVRSWSQLSPQKYLFRFSINETSGMRRRFNKIAVIEFQYVTMTLTEKELDINPVGFQVKGYQVSDDSS